MFVSPLTAAASQVYHQEKYLYGVIAAALDERFWTMTPLIALSCCITSTVHSNLTIYFIFQEMTTNLMHIFPRWLLNNWQSLNPFWMRFHVISYAMRVQNSTLSFSAAVNRRCCYTDNSPGLTAPTFLNTFSTTNVLTRTSYVYSIFSAPCRNSFAGLFITPCFVLPPWQKFRSLMLLKSPIS